jgi:NAD(P)-dependent dehydrogenase (short-subunit alcohol dehydrogenase family)
MDLGLEGCRAVVTGAGAGIGRAVVESLTREGVSVLGVDRDEAVIRELGERPAVTPLVQDLTEPDCGDRVVAAAIEALGGIDLLVNNAGAAPMRDRFTDVSDDDWFATWNLNLMAAVRLCRAAVPVLLSSPGRAAIVNVASTSARYPEPMLVDYAASKAALLAMTGALATELGPHGVRVAAVSPGPTRTPLWDVPGGFADQLAARHGLPREEAVEHHLTTVRQLALGKAGTAEDVADAITFLLSPRAGHITGSVLAVHGGMATHLL